MDNTSTLVARTCDITDETADSSFVYIVARMITGLILYPIFCLLGLVGNTLILIVFGKRSMRTSTYRLLSALAVSDIIKLANDLLYFATCLVQHINYSVGRDMFLYLYPYAHFLSSFTACVSSWLTASVTIERYILVCHPARAKQLTSVPRANIAIVVVFVSMAIFSSPFLFKYTTQQSYAASFNCTKFDVGSTL